MSVSVRLLCSSLAVVILLSAAGCGNGTPKADPSIQFSAIPPAAVGGSDRVAPIGGRVTGARSGQRIVIYTRSGVWWVQPTTAQPFTTVELDGTWNSSIHLGTEYAALLVDAGYRPVNDEGRAAAARKRRGGDGHRQRYGRLVTRASKVLTFSGYEWDVRSIPSDRGGANDYDPDNAWTDAQGMMHLKLAQREGRWTSAEVILKRELGHGTYLFTVRDVAGLDPAAALGLLTWDTEASIRITASWTSRSAAGATRSSPTRNTWCSRSMCPQTSPASPRLRGR